VRARAGDDHELEAVFLVRSFHGSPHRGRR
jgi:hypothetical protein